MENSEKELLKQHGFDVDGTMKRFLNNEELYKKCLKKFLTDESMEKLKVAYAAHDAEEGFRIAHTMKGFIANLGMEKLHRQVEPVVETLRAGTLPEEKEIEALETVYREMYELIENL